MPSTKLSSPVSDEIDDETAAFYRHVIEALNAASVRFLVGGAYALNCYAGVQRQTKDLDLFICRDDLPAADAALRQAGYETELTFPHWLAKIHAGPVYIDLVFSSGNAVAVVDDEWFEFARDAEVLGLPVKISPVEEMLWSKAFVMERERYDGADVAHLLHSSAARLDWPRLLRRFGPHWRVLLSHLVLFGFIYPDERNLIPSWVMEDLLARLHAEMYAPPSQEHHLCDGTLLSREQYLNDIAQDGYRDGREVPFGNMTPEEIAIWTDAIRNKYGKPAEPH